MPLAGHDGCCHRPPAADDHFNPHAPCGARQLRKLERDNQPRFQSTCPLRGTTANPMELDALMAFQSTCPLRGTTRIPLIHHCAKLHFNPRAPCGARRASASVAGYTTAISIHVPLAGHDWRGWRQQYNPAAFQSTCPLRGTTAKRRRGLEAKAISIHVPLAGHDSWASTLTRVQRLFQSPCPLRGTTSDVCPRRVLVRNFNPRAPCGARLYPFYQILS